MAERPRNAPGMDEKCEVCGEAMGESWGVSRIDVDNAPVGELVQYEPVHPLCWWAENPDAVEKQNARLREARDGYALAKVEKPAKIRKAG